MWLLIASELVVFGAILIAFAIQFNLQPEVFLQSQNHLNRFAGALNTMVLLTSGFFAALALRAQIDKKPGHARIWQFGSIALGCVFLAIKFLEYSEKFAQGISIDSNDFYMFYFLATGFHAAHVVFGILILLVVCWKNSTTNIITATAFWHMVDLIWVLLFPVIYLLR